MSRALRQARNNNARRAAGSDDDDDGAGVGRDGRRVGDVVRCYGAGKNYVHVIVV